MLKRYHIVDGKLIENGSPDCPVLVYIGPDDQEKGLLINQMQIDEHTLGSALDPNEVARLEFEANHTAMIVKRPKRYSSADNFLFKISSVGLFLFSDKLIIVLPEDAVIFDGRLFQKIRSMPDILLKVIFRCIQHFEEHLKVIQKISDELEGEINKALTNKDLVNMFNLEKSLVYYLNAINSNAKVIEKLKVNTARLGFSGNENEFLEDVFIENGQCYQEADTYSEVLSGMMDAWVSVVSNNLNIRIKMLTILSLCIMLPTLVVSIFSMNVKLPVPQEGTLFSFWLVMALVSASILAICLSWRYHRW